MTQAPTPPRPNAPTQRRDRAALFLGVILLSVVAIGLPILRERDAADRSVRHEDEAAAVLLRLADAQHAFHDREGRFAFLEDLVRAGLLDDFDVQGETDRRYVRTPGYRIDALLPSGRLGGGTVTLVTSEGPLPADPALARTHFSLVARPDQPGVTGWRAWYVDEDGALFLNEGVTDAEGALKNLLPQTQVKESQYLMSGRALLWQRADGLDETD